MVFEMMIVRTQVCSSFAPDVNQMEIPGSFAIRINITCFHGNKTNFNVNILWISIWFTPRIYVNNS